VSRHGPRATRIRRRAVGVATAAALAALPLSMAVFSSPATAAEPHVDNPYAGAVQYVNPTWAASVRAAAARQSDASLRAKMETVAQQPTAVWMDRISAITGNADGNGLKFHLDEAVKQQRAAGKPLVFNIVIYDLPGRDCYALASNGELPATDAGLARYKSEYIDPIAALLAKPEYSGLRISATIEPDSLPNLVTNSSEQLCQQAAPYYRAGVKYALDKLHAISNVYNYIDVAHSGWLGWDSNAGPAAQLFAEVAKSTTAGFASVDGFVSDVANSTPLEEPFLTNSSMTLNNNPIRSSKFYEWNFDFDEIDFTAHMHSLLVQAGFPSSLGMLIDTSRNGWGGPNRPTKVSTSTDINTYVDQSRVDRRVHRGAWCNPLGAGIGELPRATPSGYTSSHLDAFVWIKPPGESDGASSEIENDQGKHFDRMCDPTFVSPKLANQLTGATPNAPLAGQWFEEQFVTLVKNAYPVINGSTTTPTPEPTHEPTQEPTQEPTHEPTQEPTQEPTHEPTQNPSGSCQVTYQGNGWNTGVSANVRVKNTGSTALNGWTLEFTFPSGQHLDQGWSAEWSQSGAKVTAKNAAWNGSIAPGGTVDIGFNASHNGTNTAPTAFTLNGASCTVA